MKNEEETRPTGLPSRAPAEKGFFAQYWLWMLMPLLVILGVLLYLVLSEDSDAQFIYSFW